MMLLDVSWNGLIDKIPCVINELFWLIGCLIFVVKVVKPIVERLIISRVESKKDEEKFNQEKFWKFMQLSQIDEDAEIKKKAEELAKNLANDKFNEKRKELDDSLKQKELDWYKKMSKIQ